MQEKTLTHIKEALLFVLLSFSLTIEAKVSFKWLGVSGFVLTDEKTTLIFDPAMTRAGLLDFLPFQTIETDKKEVDYWFERCGVSAVNAIFVNHTHVDHVIDAPYVLRKYGGKLYGSSSVINVGLGHGIQSNQLQLIEAGQEWKVGDFTIIPYSTPHSPHLLGITLMNGHITAPLSSPTSIWNYKTGDTFSFYITHPEGSILFQAIGRVTDDDPLEELKADALVLTIANRISTENLIKRFESTGANTVIPLHYDNFFKKMRRDNQIDILWGVKTDEFKQTTAQRAAQVKILWPKYCQDVRV